MGVKWREIPCSTARCPIIVPQKDTEEPAPPVSLLRQIAAVGIAFAVICVMPNHREARSGGET